MPVKVCFAGFIGIVFLLYFVGLLSSRHILQIPVRPEDSLTVLINTFNRHDRMAKSVEHYATCPVVKYINVVWSEQREPPEAYAMKFAMHRTPKISFERHDSESLNNRFKPLKNEHSDAIFNVDDDMLVPCDELTLGYNVWKGSQRSIVGFMPRVHMRGPDNRFVYRCWWRVWWHGHYSIILTKAAFLHHDYFEMYTRGPQSVAVHKLVDDERNCEDIAMQFLIANTTHLPPLYVKGHLKDSGVLGGISTSQNVVKASHMDHRSECVNKLIELYGGRSPLVHSNIIIDSAMHGWTTNEPSTWWELISSDLWNYY